jgi:ketosteroid isomerase-like protein
MTIPLPRTRAPAGRVRLAAPVKLAAPLLLAILALLLAACAARAPAAAATLDTVVAIERARLAALQANDLQALEAVLAPDLRYCHSTGVCETRAQFLDALRSGQMRYRRIEVLALEPRAAGAAVLIHGRLDLEVESRGTLIPMQLVYTDVYAQRAGRWQLIAWQSTRAPAAPAP